MQQRVGLTNSYAPPKDDMKNIYWCLANGKRIWKMVRKFGKIHTVLGCNIVELLELLSCCCWSKRKVFFRQMPFLLAAQSLVLNNPLDQWFLTRVPRRTRVP